MRSMSGRVCVARVAGVLRCCIADTGPLALASILAGWAAGRRACAVLVGLSYPGRIGSRAAPHPSISSRQAGPPPSRCVGAVLVCAPPSPSRSATRRRRRAAGLPDRPGAARGLWSASRRLPLRCGVGSGHLKKISLFFNFPLDFVAPQCYNITKKSEGRFDSGIFEDHQARADLCRMGAGSAVRP